MTLLKRFLARSAFLVLLSTGVSAVSGLVPDATQPDFHTSTATAIVMDHSDGFALSDFSPFVVERVYAADTTGSAGGEKGGTTAAAATTDGMMLVVSLINSFISVISYISFPLVMLAGWLLTPDWTFGDIFGLRPILHSLWVLVSNVVYVIFALMLVVVAFVNIFSSNQHYELKSALPKLFKGILIVPFTWFIVSATLSISNVLTASIMQLPLDVIGAVEWDGKGYFEKAFNESKVIPKNITVDLTEWKSASDGKSKGSDVSQSKCPDDCMTIKEMYQKVGWAYSMLNTYAYGIFKIWNLKEITGQSVAKGTITMVLQIVKSLSFGTLYAVVFMLIIIALVYALFTRAVALWMYAIFSPLFALNIGLEWIMPKNFDKLTKKASITEFIGLAMVPVYVSAALAFWLIFTSLVMWGLANIGSKSDYVKFSSSANEQSMEFAWVTLKTIGDFRSDGEDGKVQQVGAGIIGTVIMGFVSILVIWLGVMAALESSSITASAVSPIAQFGKSIGQLAMKAPQYVPIPIPGSGGKKMSMAGLERTGSNIANAVQSASQATGSDYGTTIGNAIAKWMGLPVQESARAAQALQDLANQAKTLSTAVPKDKWALVSKALSLPGLTLGELSSNQAIRANFSTMLKNMWLEKQAEEFESTRDEWGMIKFLHKLESNNAATWLFGSAHGDNDQTIKQWFNDKAITHSAWSAAWKIKLSWGDKAGQELDVAHLKTVLSTNGKEKLAEEMWMKNAERAVEIVNWLT